MTIGAATRRLATHWTKKLPARRASGPSVKHAQTTPRVALEPPRQFGSVTTDGNGSKKKNQRLLSKKSSFILNHPSSRR